MTVIETELLETRGGPILPEDQTSRQHGGLAWSPIALGALVAAAISAILLTFGASVGLGVSSASPSWRDASIALWLLSGIFLILQALLAFGLGGYLAGRTRRPEGRIAASEIGDEATERQDGLHGIGSWALGILIAIVIAACIAAAASRPTALTTPASTVEPSVLSYEIDHLLRSPRRLPVAEEAPLRAEAGRILLTSSSHRGVTQDDRTYLAQLVGGAAGLSGPDAERRVDASIANSRKALSNARASTIILAFSLAASLLLGAIAAWAGAVAGGRHRDGETLPNWMTHFNRSGRRSMWSRPAPMP